MVKKFSRVKQDFLGRSSNWFCSLAAKSCSCLLGRPRTVLGQPRTVPGTPALSAWFLRLKKQLSARGTHEDRSTDAQIRRN